LKTELRRQRQLSCHGLDSANIKLPAARFLSSGRTRYPIHVSYQNLPLAEDSRETRLGLSAAARKAAETFAKMRGSKGIKHAQAHRHVTISASVLHRWDDKGNPVPFSLNVLNIGSFGIKVGDETT